MSRYEAKITKDATEGFFALVVRVDRDGSKSVVNHYKGRYFKTEKAAINSTSKYIKASA